MIKNNGFIHKHHFLQMQKFIHCFLYETELHKKTISSQINSYLTNTLSTSSLLFLKKEALFKYTGIIGFYIRNTVIDPPFPYTLT